ncbi:MAG TPA: SUMF1/EgtB/PvdO family nonheme iron enzyme [Thermoanaerobaculia bacterium]|nr:SUMF1/EgtB/PvdO family nonheme iron enzyme [Thermoanaerobaculia bacterium]
MNTPLSKSASPASPVDRDDMLQRWRDGRAFTRVLFDQLLPEDAWLENPIPVRHPFVFYEGHLAAFCVNTLVKGALGRPGVDAMLERLFERGIDPKDKGEGARFAWPTRERVLDYVRRAEAAVEDAITTVGREGSLDPLHGWNEALHAIVEHELMHQETLLYMLREVPTAAKRRPASLEALRVGGAPPAKRRVAIPAGCATLGLDRETATFAWDNEFPRIVSDVPGFEIDAFPVTNADFLEFVEADGYREKAFWDESDFNWIHGEGITHPHAWVKREGAWWCRAMFEEAPLPPAWPVWVSRAEADAYARFRGRRIPTEAEWHRAAFGRPDRRESAFPWGEGSADPRHGNFGVARFDPVPVDSFPSGASAFGVQDLVGNGWEWTASEFRPFPGFRPMASYPRYSADFFDGDHAVLKGASPVTAVPLVRRSFRNWFRTQYPFVFAKFRTAGR